jgi:hypothetical protein
MKMFGIKILLNRTFQTAQSNPSLNASISTMRKMLIFFVLVLMFFLLFVAIQFINLYLSPLYNLIKNLILQF